MITCDEQIVLSLSDEERHNQALSQQSLEHALSLFKKHGFLKVSGVFCPEYIGKLRKAFLEGVEICPDMKLSSGAKISSGRYIVPVPLQGVFNSPSLYASPFLMPLIKALLGEFCILSSLGCVTSLPDATDQHIHTDYYPLFEEDHDLNSSLLTYGITMAIPLVNVDLINGPTKVWSGSHRSYPKERNLKGYTRYLVHGDIGCCYFWDYRTFHAGGSNFSDQLRPLLYLTYTRRWFSDLLNDDFLMIEDDEWKKVPECYASLFLKYISQKRKPIPARLKIS